VTGELELEVGPVAHGGHCVARHEGQVVFVRHALPGELVRARVTERTSKYLRADAIEILRPAADRVPAPCPYAGPGRCGGCDFQHVSVDGQRRLKASVVSDTLRRIGRIDREVTVEAVPLEGADDGLGWRTRMRYAVVSGRPGMFAHRSHRLIDIDRCLIAHPGTPEVLGREWPGTASVLAAVSSEGRTAVGTDEQPAGRLHERIGERRFRVAADGFWQVHPRAASVLVDTVLAGLEPSPGETALDLYAGVGVFAAFLAEAGCAVLAVEGDKEAVRSMRRNLHDLPAVTIEGGRVDKVLRSAAAAGLESVDLVVLDPPRTGAGADVVRRIVALGPRRVAYVACDPAALARDLRTFADLGYQLGSLRAFDLFPMTHHVECVAVLEPA
jgi:tRNA/tmRNA/rRNA uracil-C5-methylase (TrmA/RlmC/RlmD family)